MSYLLSTIRKLFFWNYARNTLQWEILCVLILTFIFFTPKSWFEGSERRRVSAHQSRTSTLLVGPEVVENAEDRVRLQERVQTLTGRPEAQVIEVRKVLDQEGKTRGYEVDIR